MIRTQDFDIQDGVFLHYLGSGGDVTIPNGVKEIGERAFRGCKSLTGIRIPEGVTSIGFEAFQGCSELAGLILPGSLNSIYRRAFHGCRSLADQGGFVIVRGCLFDYFGPGGDIRIPDGVTVIGMDSFKGCTSITDVILPEGLAQIEPSAFSGCTGLKKIKIPGGLTDIGNYAFFGCTGLTVAAIPDSTQIIEPGAFADCSSLRHVDFSEKTDIVWKDAFYRCRGLEDPDGFAIQRGYLLYYAGNQSDVTIPDGVTCIGSCAFSGMDSLTSVTIPTSVTTIRDMAFLECENLTSLVIPEGVRYIGKNAFEECIRLTCIRLPKSIEEIETLYDMPLFVQYVICQTPYAASHSYFPVYLGGGLSDLEPDKRAGAVYGFLYAVRHGIHEMDSRRDEYMAYIRDHIRDLVEYSLRSADPSHRHFHLFAIQEEFLGEEEAKVLFARYKDTGDMEMKAALLQYYHGHFGSPDPGNLSI